MNLIFGKISGILFATAVVGIVSASQKSYASTFIELCENGVSLPPSQQKTVQAIIDNLEEPFDGKQIPVWPWDCKNAAKKLEKRTELILRDPTNSFLPPYTTVGTLEPLVALQNIKKLRIERKGFLDSNDESLDIAPLGEMPNLQSLVLKVNKIKNAFTLNQLKLKSLEIPASEIPELRYSTIESIVTSGEGEFKISTLGLPMVLKSLSIHDAAVDFSGFTITHSLPNSLENLKLDSVQLSSGVDFEYFKKLKKLVINYGEVDQLKFIGSRNLIDLELNSVTGVQEDDLATASRLKKLRCIECDLTTSTFLENMPELTELDLTGNSIKTWTSIEATPRLKILRVAGNTADYPLIDAVSRKLSELEVFDASTTQLGYLLNVKSEKLKEIYLTNNDFVAPPNLPQSIEVVDLTENNLQTIDNLAGKLNLRELKLSSNRLRSIYVLKNLPKLSQMREMDVSQNLLTSLDGLQVFTSATTINARDNFISDISALSGLNSMQLLYLGMNNLSDTTALRGKTTIKYLDLQKNVIADISDISTLTGLNSLLDLSFNKIEDASPLKSLRGNELRLILRGNPLISQICPIEQYCEF